MEIIVFLSHTCCRFSINIFLINFLSGIVHLYTTREEAAGLREGGGCGQRLGFFASAPYIYTSVRLRGVCVSCYRHVTSSTREIKPQLRASPNMSFLLLRIYSARLVRTIASNETVKRNPLFDVFLLLEINVCKDYTGYFKIYCKKKN